MDADRILVMTEGKAGEFDKPYDLLVLNEGDEKITKRNSLFAQMVLATGEETSK